MKSKKTKFIDICINKLNTHEFIIDKSKVPTDTILPYEAVFIELSRKLPHIEYLLLNAIDKLPNNMFSFSIVCTNENHDFMQEMVNKIDFPITIHLLPEDIQIKNVNDYNELLYTLIFWELFRKRQKILVMQEDTFIFKTNISEFYDFDYIGAPWAYSVLKNYDIRVGNGGFSFRSMKLIFEALENKTEIMDIIKKNKKSFYYSRQLTNIPEDVFFSFAAKYLENYNLPTFDEAKSFSTENIVSKESMGGHQFYNMDKNWESRLDEI